MTLTDTSIRRATAEDALLVYGFYLAMLRELRPYGHDIAPTPSNATTYWRHIFLPAIEEDEDCILLHEHGALFWVKAAVVDWTEPYAIDHGCYVEPEWRQTGIATALREAGIVRLRQLGVTSLITTILTANKIGLASYRKLSPVQIGVLMKVSI